MKRKPYDMIPLIPTLCAEAVMAEVYTMSEVSDQCRSGIIAEKIEAKRQKMTIKQRNEFADLCEERCRKAYAIEAEWFEKCVKGKGNEGRGQLYMWIRHWLSAYLQNPKQFRERITQTIGKPTI